MNTQVDKEIVKLILRDGSRMTMVTSIAKEEWWIDSSLNGPEFMDHEPLYKKIPVMNDYSREENAADPLKLWFLQYEGSEFGPMSKEEAVAVLKSRKLSGKVLARRKARRDWHEVSDFFELREALAGWEDTKSSEKRENHRSPFLATARFSSHGANGSRLGICADISEGGMRIHSRYKAGKVGDEIHLTVRPSSGSDEKAFRVKAKIVRYLDGGKGFSVKFISEKSAA